MTARHLWLAFASLLACRPAAPIAEVPAPATPELPTPIDLPTEFSGSPIRVTTLDGGIVVESLADGEGERATEGKVVRLESAFYRADTGERMPWRLWRIEVGEEAGSPLSAVARQVIAGQQPGARTRVFVPACIVDAGKPARAPAIGAVWFTVEIEQIEQVRVPPQLAGLDAYGGEPIATMTLDDGVEVHDFAPGEGPTVVDGDLVEYVEIAITFGDRTIFSNPNEIPNTEVVGEDFPKGKLAGARVGMLRKYIVPRGYKYKDGTAELPRKYVVYFQVTRIEPKE